MGQEGTQQNAFHLKDLWEVIRKRRWVVATFFVVLVTVVLIGTLSQTPIYRATTTIAILPDTPKVLNFQSIDDFGSGNYYMYQDYYNTQNRIIQSNHIARRVIDRLGLKQEGKEGKEVTMTPGYFLAHLEVTPIKESQLVKISYNHPDPAEATRVANAIAEVYIEDNLEQRLSLTKQAVDWLSERLAELKNQVVESEQKMFEFKNKNRLVGLDDKQNLMLQKLVDLNTAYSRARAERIEVEARWKRLDRLVRAGTDREALVEVLSSQLVQNLKQQLIDMQREHSQLSARYLPEHPKMRRLHDQISFVNQRIEGEITKILEAARTEYVLKRAEENSLGAELETAKQEALELHKKFISHMAIQQDAEKNQQLYDILLGRLKEADLTSSLRANNLRIIDSALEPSRPVKPRVQVNMALAVLVGLVGGIGLAFFFEYVDNTIKTTEDIERHVQLPLLGVIPDMADANEESTDRDLFVHTHPKSTIAESCRSIRTNLMFLGAEKPLHSFIVTSATPLEGKSTTTCNLGITLAQAGQRVVLVDADLRRSRLHKTFGLRNDAGFSTLLLGSNDVASVMLPTDIPNLWVIPSGPLPPNPSELLTSARMDEVLKMLEQEFDRVVFDSPPVIPVTDAIVLGRKVDGVLYVVKSGKVSRDLVAEARRRLVEVDTNVLGVVLNGLDVTDGAYAYQYQYYYGSDDEEPAA